MSPRKYKDNKYVELKLNIIQQFNTLDTGEQDFYLSYVVGSYKYAIKNKRNIIKAIIQGLWITKPPLKRKDIALDININPTKVTYHEKKIVNALALKFDLIKENK